MRPLWHDLLNHALSSLKKLDFVYCSLWGIVNAWTRTENKLSWKLSDSEWVMTVIEKKGWESEQSFWARVSELWLRIQAGKRQAFQLINSSKLRTVTWGRNKVSSEMEHEQWLILESRPRSASGSQLECRSNKSDYSISEGDWNRTAIVSNK